MRDLPQKMRMSAGEKCSKMSSVPILHSVPTTPVWIARAAHWVRSPHKLIALLGLSTNFLSILTAAIPIHAQMVVTPVWMLSEPIRTPGSGRE